MALNPNHTFEDLGDVKCSIIEKNCSTGRVEFLKQLLEHNKFNVIVVNSPAPKAAAKPAAAVAGAEATATVSAEPPPPETFTVGVTDLSFNVSNAIFNRELKSNDGKIVTPKYWKQLESSPEVNSWYWNR